MATERRHWSPDEKKTARQLHKEGWTYRKIAEKLRPGVKTAWRTVGDIIRDARKAPSTSIVQGITPTSIRSSSSVELPEGMVDSLTAKEFMNMMDDHQQEIFVATYEDLRGDVDEESLTSAENEMLIRASYSHIKYLRAQALLNTAENYLMMELEGSLPDTDAGSAMRRFAGNRESYKKECEQWQKEYMDYLEGLKMTRKQRLDKIKDTRNTFLDLQQQLNEEAKRTSIIEDIKRINDKTEAEFRRMAKGEPDAEGKVYKWLIGSFEDYLGEPKETSPNKQLEEKKD